VKSIESTGKTIDEAVMMAVMQLGVSRDNLEIEVLEQPEKGRFGLFGGKNAKIRVTVKNPYAEVIEQPEQAPKKEEAATAEKGAVKAEGDTSNASAEEFLLSLFKHMQIEAEYKIEKQEKTMIITLFGQNMGLLIGHRGETLDAIQYLVSLLVNKGNEEFIRVVVDTENYRLKREKTLEKLAKRLADKVVKSKRKISLEPMNPYERRIIHATLQDHQYVTTKSEGEEPYRKVVILYKR